MIFTSITNKLGGYWGLRMIGKHSTSAFKRRIATFLLRRFQHEIGSYLPFNNQIDGPINFLHGPYGIFISGDAYIGKNCSIYQQVTIGSNILIGSKTLGSPTIGDNCLIGAGAKIIGNITIGHNCRIGANCVVNSDVPDNSIMVMGTPVIIQQEKLVNKIHRKMDAGWGYMQDGVFHKEEDPDVLRELNGE